MKRLVAAIVIALLAFAAPAAAKGKGPTQQQVRDAVRPSPAPRIIIDIIFPPFRTLVDDPVLPETKVVTGQWFD